MADEKPKVIPPPIHHVYLSARYPKFGANIAKNMGKEITAHNQRLREAGEDIDGQSALGKRKNKSHYEIQTNKPN